MLRDRHPVDKLFADILTMIPPMDPGLVKIDQYLEDETLFRLVRDDLSRRRPLTLITGRNSTPVEVIERMLVVIIRGPSFRSKDCRNLLEEVQMS